MSAFPHHQVLLEPVQMERHGSIVLSCSLQPLSLAYWSALPELGGEIPLQGAPTLHKMTLQDMQSQGSWSSICWDSWPQFTPPPVLRLTPAMLLVTLPSPPEVEFPKTATGHCLSLCFPAQREELNTYSDSITGRINE